MNKELAHELRLMLNDIKIFSKIAGIAQPVIVTQPSATDKTIDKVIPVTYDHNVRDCESQEIDLVPNSTERGILYFEDLGTKNTSQMQGGYIDFQSRLNLVGWLNKSLITGNQYDEITGKVIVLILSKLKVANPINVGIFKKLSVKIDQIAEQSANIFKRYTYDEKATQFLRPPYEYFAITLICNFSILPSCIEQEFEFSDWACYNDKDALITEVTEIPILTQTLSTQTLKEK